MSDRVSRSVHTIRAPEVEPVRSLVPFAWMAIAAAAVAVVASTALPVRNDAGLSVRAAIAPADPVAARWLNMSAPPSAGDVLMRSMTGAR